MQLKSLAAIAILGFAALMIAWPVARAPVISEPVPQNPENSFTAAAAATGRFTREANLDRSGNDIRSDKLAAGASVDDCEHRCDATKGCVAYTFVKKSTTVPEPICWLKDTVPHGYPSNCCTSGVRIR